MAFRVADNVNSLGVEMHSDVWIIENSEIFAIINLSCIAFDALSWSLLTSKWTWLAYFVKYIASSVAVSPPPTTART